MTIVLFTRHKTPLPLLFSRQTPITSQNSNGYSVVHTSQNSTATVVLTTDSHNVTKFQWLMAIMLFTRHKTPRPLLFSRQTPITSQNSNGYSVVHTSQNSSIAYVYSHAKISQERLSDNFMHRKLGSPRAWGLQWHYKSPCSCLKKDERTDKRMSMPRKNETNINDFHRRHDVYGNFVTSCE